MVMQERKMRSMYQEDIHSYYKPNNYIALSEMVRNREDEGGVIVYVIALQ